MNRIGLYLWIPVLLIALRSSFGSDQGPAFEDPVIHRLWQQKVSLEHEEVPLRKFLESGQSVYHFSFFIDRRIDPDLPIRCSMNDVSLLEGVHKIAKDHDLSFHVLGQNLYIGPKDGAGELQLLIAIHRNEIAQNPKILNRLLKKVPFKSDFGSDPKILLEELARKFRFQWIDLNRLPHDCWRELDLYPISSVDLMSLLLVGFHVRFTADPELDHFRLSLWKEEDQGDLSVPDKYLTDSIKAHFSSCQFEGTGSSITVHGPLRDLSALNTDLLGELFQKRSERIAERESDRPKKSAGKGIRELSGSVKNNKLRDLFDYLGKSFDLQFELDPSLKSKGIDLDTLITCEFKKSQRSAVLAIIAKTLNCQYRMEDNRVIFY
ncbi:MAG: hypothetical protein Q4G69_03580 [Planctomycetia bacterium]|nr:hypothetical protein [Planctomycetia bacterium]